MKNKTVLIALCCISLSACAHVSIQKKSGHSLIKSQEQRVSVANKNSGPVNLSGSWRIGVRYQDKTETGNMQIHQINQSFSGQGRDDHSGATFKIEQGVIKGEEILFLKRYDKHPALAIQYHGQFSYLPGQEGETPYMSGDFSFEQNGAVIVGDWEAASDIKVSVPQQTRKKIETEESKPTAKASKQIHSHDLSGKWKTAYEYNFKTIHSTMFLEQDGDKITGHGLDNETKEKFVIKKGWYTPPHLTIIRQYPNRVGNSSMTFQAEVSEVCEEDYSGPYVSGKTQGGGEWEAERVF